MYTHMSSENEHGTWKHLYEKEHHLPKPSFFRVPAGKVFPGSFIADTQTEINKPENMCFVHLGKSHTFEVLTN